MASGCGPASPSREDFVERYVETNPEASVAEGGCVIDELIRRYSIEGLTRELEAVPPAAAFERAQFEAAFGCGITGEIEAELARQLEATGIAAADATCAAEELTGALSDDDLDVLLSGEITDEFYAKYFTALDECGAVP